MQTTIKLPYSISEKGKKPQITNKIFPATDTATSNDNFFLVCSGFGETQKAEISATLVCEELSKYIKETHIVKTERLGQIYMNDALRYTERRMQEYIRNNNDVKGMNGAFALAHINLDGTATVAWAGNCRVYHIRQNKILYRSEDHLTNIRHSGESKIIPRGITGNEPAWVSISTITDFQDDDYLFLCSPGVLQTFDDRNIKYLFSQGNGSDTTNQAIIDKIRELCGTNSTDSYSAYLIQSEHTPFVPMDDYNDDVNQGGDIFFENMRVPDKNKFELGVAVPKQLFLIIPIIFFVILASLGVRHFLKNPNRTFEQQLTEGQSLLEKGQYQDAILTLENALSLGVSDVDAQFAAQQSLQKAKEALTIQYADSLEQIGEFIEARAVYEKLNAESDIQNATVEKNLASLNDILNSQKQKFVTKGDSLFGARQFEKAKNKFLYALHIDRDDTAIWNKINACNVPLKQDSLTLENALSEARLRWTVTSDSIRLK
ncbi:MAG: hypothetical protein ACPG5B_16005 [Chitinophagales bacterium]